MLRITVEHSFRHFTVAAAFEGPASGITVLFGPSGSGKSTILAAIAGLLRPDRLDIDLAGQQLHRIRAHRRRIGMVFQDGRLFPHLTVKQNLSYGLKRAPRGPIFVDETLGLLGIEPLLQRYPGTLSGGEQQRVAIGRALLSQPRLLLMDEPLGALDALTRLAMQALITRIWQAQKFTAILVTHDVHEAVTLGDTVILLERGRIAETWRIDRPRPRDTGDAELAAIEGAILRRLLQSERA